MTDEVQTLFDDNLSKRAIVKIALPLHLPTVLDYVWGGDVPPCVGQFALVDVGKKSHHGLVVEVADASDYKRLKEAFPLDVPPLHPTSTAFLRWVARYTMSAPGDALRALLMKKEVPEEPQPTSQLYATGALPARPTPKREKVLACAGQTGWESASELAQAAGVSPAVVSALVKEGVFEKRVVEEGRLALNLNLAPLSPLQQQAAGEMAAQVARGAFAPMLLDGVVGSGKTEVYFDTIARVLEADDQAQVLVLVPEIALTPQWLGRFKQRFGFAPTLWHSSVGETQKRKNWWQVHRGDARVVIGARSALFLPFRQLGLVVVDEEHDASYKQDEGFTYHGRDMAVALANMWQVPIVLASATPSLETWHHATHGKYAHIVLDAPHGEAGLAPIELVDMKLNGPYVKGQFLSPVLLGEIEARLKKGEQTLLFLNRRGVAPLLICTGCGHRVGCPSCEATLTVHGHKLMCHHCGYNEFWPETCSECGSDKLVAFGPGTRKIMAEVQAAFPHAVVDVADSDAITTQNKMDALVSRMVNGDIDILVGTQMIAKGHHFPKLTLVGVIDADMGLAMGDMRAAERTFQLLMQVSGRAGREALLGKVMLQSYDVAHPLFKALQAHDRDAFFEFEADARRLWKDPPFGRQIALVMSGRNEMDVLRYGQALAQGMPHESGVEVLGPAPAPLARVKDRFRYRLLVKSDASAHKIVKEWLEKTPMPQSVRLDIDVDPVNFY